MTSQRVSWQEDSRMTCRVTREQPRSAGCSPMISKKLRLFGCASPSFDSSYHLADLTQEQLEVVLNEWFINDGNKPAMREEL
uniref:Uncharacterized protein n=1 Tax=Heterorhabditis bacteriophora TaxID=37862 RepID=A0A1I7XQK6_HETBA